MDNSPIRSIFLETEFLEFFKILDKLENEIFFLFDCREQKFVHVSHSVKIILGFSPEHLIDRGMDLLSSIIHPKDFYTVLKWYATSISSIKQIKFQSDTSYSDSICFRLRHGKGRWILTETSFTLLPRVGEEDGGRIIGTIIDLSTWKDHFKNSATLRANANQSSSYNSSGWKVHESVSSREREVLYLIANGLSSKEVADRLFISVHTAINHRKNLIEKFHVKNTAELINVASRYYWL